MNITLSFQLSLVVTIIIIRTTYCSTTLQMKYAMISKCHYLIEDMGVSKKKNYNTLIHESFNQFIDKLL